MHTDQAQVRELAREQQHLAAARAALRRMRGRAEALFATGDGLAVDEIGAEALGTALARRVAQLAEHPDIPLFFGKLSFQPPSHTTGEVHHIGRRHVTDPAGDPMVVDWRAPVARAFYRASAADPLGVAVRRRFGYAGGALTSFEDEHLDRGQELGTASRILIDEIERPRVGPMRDIVATIQPDQDELVRADLDRTICVQGAPGTGKTAVGLHRAAYLLYLHRDRLRRSGVLILGPNRAFLHYIEAVLPALGEVDVRQSTIDDLLVRVPVRAADDPATAAVKHDGRMAVVLRNALWGRVRVPTEPLVVPDGSFRWRVGVDALTRVIGEVRRERLPYAAGRERVRARLVGLLQRQAELRRADSPGEAWLRRMGRSKPVTTFLDTAWPSVTPEGLVSGLLSDPAALAEAAAGVLDEAEQRRLIWPPPPRPTRSARAARWSEADAILLDEAAGLLERTPSFGHVVIDEAQDLSAMQLRAIGRRTQHGSVTLLGDLAQGTAPWAAADWPASLAHLGKPDAAVVPLTIGFRVPHQVVALANRLLPALGVDVPEAVSLRRDGSLAVRRVGAASEAQRPRSRAVRRPEQVSPQVASEAQRQPSPRVERPEQASPEIADAVVAEVHAALAAEGSIAVIAADAAAEPLRGRLAAAGIELAAVDDPGSAARVTMVPAALAKGLEFDHVILVEPAAIVAAEPRGLHRLYVVLTRAVSHLVVLHAEPLPAPLAPRPPAPAADQGKIGTV